LEKKEEILELKPALSKIIESRRWLSEEKNWVILKAKALVWRPLTYSVQMR